MFKNTLVIGCLAVAALVFVNNAYAHVTVKPAEVGVGKYQTFTMGVPVEKEVPTTALRLVIPQGVESVMPNVKPGWKIDLKKEGTGEDAKVTEITWTGGVIPIGQRDEFYFSAKTPAKATTLQWKAYQTYQDGTVVAWEKTADEMKGVEGFETFGPFSETKIVDDLSTSPTSTHNASTGTPASETKPAATQNMVSYIALAISLISLTLAYKKK